MKTVIKNKSKDRLKEFIRLKGDTVKGFEERIGRGNAYINSLKDLSAVVINAAVAIYPDLNIDWLVTGEGEPFKTSVATTDTVPIVNMFALGGTLTEQLDSSSVNALECVQTPVKGAEMAIEVSGDSMAPKYPSGSRLFCRRVDDPTFIEWGKVYVIDTNQGAVVKELRPGSSHDTVMCHSLNDNKKYVPFEVPFSSIRGIWKVLAGLILE